MVHSKEIDQAIAAHSYWKDYLRNAIMTGKIDRPIETIRSDNQCIFGKWLDACMLTCADSEAYHYVTIKELHAKFHETAAGVAEMVAAAKLSAAEKMIAPDGEFAKMSTQLTLAMNEWKKSLT